MAKSAGMYDLEASYLGVRALGEVRQAEAVAGGDNVAAGADAAPDGDAHPVAPPSRTPQVFLPGSPFQLCVMGVKASASGSSVGGVESIVDAAAMPAGERFLLHALLRDEFGNASTIAPGDLR